MTMALCLSVRRRPAWVGKAGLAGRWLTKARDGVDRGTVRGTGL